MKKWIVKLIPVVDVLLLPLVYMAAWLLKTLRSIGVHRLPNSKSALLKVGVFPIRDHYYEPQFDFRNLAQSLPKERALPGIDWNKAEQLEWLASFSFAEELANLPMAKPDSLDFCLNNGAFEAGDAEYWYQLIRAVKPKRIFEVGSGNSTLMAIKAIRKNKEH